MARLLTQDETRKRLRISRTLLYRLRDWGDLPVVKIGGRVFFDESDVDALIEKKKEEKDKTTRAIEKARN